MLSLILLGLLGVVVAAVVVRMEDKPPRRGKRLILACGPVGHGKSCTANAVADTLKCSHVDGDKPFDRRAELFGKNRNKITVSAVIDAFASKDTVVVSTGGGAFCTFGKNPKYILQERLNAAYPNTEFEVYLMYPSETFAKPSTPVFEWYYDPNHTSKSVEDRVKKGVWQLNKKTLKDLLVTIDAVCKRNIPFVRAIHNYYREQLKRVTFPVVIDGQVTMSSEEILAVFDNRVAETVDTPPVVKSCYCLRIISAFTDPSITVDETHNQSEGYTLDKKVKVPYKPELGHFLMVVPGKV